MKAVIDLNQFTWEFDHIKELFWIPRKELKKEIENLVDIDEIMEEGDFKIKYFFMDSKPIHKLGEKPKFKPLFLEERVFDVELEDWEKERYLVTNEKVEIEKNRVYFKTEFLDEEE